MILSPDYCSEKVSSISQSCCYIISLSLPLSLSLSLSLPLSQTVLLALRRSERLAPRYKASMCWWEREREKKKRERERERERERWSWCGGGSQSHLHWWCERVTVPLHWANGRLVSIRPQLAALHRLLPTRSKHHALPTGPTSLKRCTLQRTDTPLLSDCKAVWRTRGSVRLLVKKAHV